jgi:type II secretory pathway component PulF
MNARTQTVGRPATMRRGPRRFSRWTLWKAHRLVRADDRSRIYAKLARLLENGVALADALATVHRRAVRMQGTDGPLAVMLIHWRRAVDDGQNLREALQEWVPGPEQMMISAGERSGHVVEAFRGVIAMTRGNREITRAVRRAVSLPLFYVALITLLAVLASVTIVPVFATALPREKWTGSAAAFASFGDLMREWGIPMLVGLFLAIALFIWSLPNWTGPLRTKLDRLPPYSLYRFWAGTGFLLALAALVRGAVSLEEALETLRVGSRAWMRERLDAIYVHIHAGQDIGPAMELAGHGFPDEQIVDDMHVYGVLGGFDDALQKTADDWLEEAVDSVKDRAGILNQGAMMLAGAMLLWLAYSLFDLIMQITDAAGSSAGL